MYFYFHDFLDSLSDLLHCDANLDQVCSRSSNLVHVTCPVAPFDKILWKLGSFTVSLILRHMLDLRATEFRMVRSSVRSLGGASVAHIATFLFCNWTKTSSISENKKKKTS